MKPTTPLPEIPVAAPPKCRQPMKHRVTEADAIGSGECRPIPGLEEPPREVVPMIRMTRRDAFDFGYDAARGAMWAVVCVVPAVIGIGLVGLAALYALVGIWVALTT